MENLLIGWKAIADYLGCCERTAKAKRDELSASGVIFYQRLGRPPQKRVCAWPGKIRAWTARKSMIGEVC